MIDTDCHKYIDFRLVRSWSPSTQFITHNRNLCLSRVEREGGGGLQQDGKWQGSN